MSANPSPEQILADLLRNAQGPQNYVNMPGQSDVVAPPNPQAMQAMRQDMAPPAAMTPNQPPPNPYADYQDKFVRHGYDQLLNEAPAQGILDDTTRGQVLALIQKGLGVSQGGMTIAGAPEAWASKMHALTSLLQADDNARTNGGYRGAQGMQKYTSAGGALNDLINGMNNPMLAHSASGAYIRDSSAPGGVRALRMPDNPKWAMHGDKTPWMFQTEGMTGAPDKPMDVTGMGIPIAQAKAADEALQAPKTIAETKHLDAQSRAAMAQAENSRANAEYTRGAKTERSGSMSALDTAKAAAQEALAASRNGGGQAAGAAIQKQRATLSARLLAANADEKTVQQQLGIFDRTVMQELRSSQGPAAAPQGNAPPGGGSVPMYNPATGRFE